MFSRVGIFHIVSFSQCELLISEMTLIRVSINAFWCILWLEINDSVGLSL